MITHRRVTLPYADLQELWGLVLRASGMFTGCGMLARVARVDGVNGVEGCAGGRKPAGRPAGGHRTQRRSTRQQFR